MEKRVLLALFLSFLVFYIYQAFMPAPVPKKQAAPLAAPSGESPAVGSPAAQTPPGASGTPATPAPAPAVVAAPQTPAAAAIVSEQAERTITIETELARVVMTNRGAQVVSWQLNHYKDDAKEPLELVPQALPAAHPRPLTLRVDDAAVTERINTALYSVDATDRIDARTAPRTLTFEYQETSGLRVRKAITFDPLSYVVGLSWDVADGSRVFNPTIVWGPALGTLSGQTNSYLQKPQGILHREGKVERWNAGDLAEQPVQEARFRYVGVDDHYFAVIALPAVPARAEYEPLSFPVPGDRKVEFVSWGVRIARDANDLRLFVGPKDFDVLQGIDQELVRVIHFGIFSWLAVPLLRALKGINGYIGNYGWSIITLTLLINLAMFPLRHKSVVSMRKMQGVQPEVKKIQERYKGLKTTDPARQKMNQEMMNLYREKGVNPASGCLPMLLTLPVLIAFYSLLSQAIEIRHAPFALWIQDLSAYDPYYVTPILMGLTMLWQQRITPSTVDPAQQRMMMLMPVVFLVMFLWAPSGLVIYWLFSNLLAIGQQYATNRMIGPLPVAPAARPPAERRVKKVGGSRSEAASGGGAVGGGADQA